MVSSKKAIIIFSVPGYSPMGMMAGGGPVDPFMSGSGSANPAAMMAMSQGGYGVTGPSPVLIVHNLDEEK
jgi:hypothetical protein